MTISSATMPGSRPAATVLAPAGPESSSAHLRRLAPEVRRTLESKRLLFTATAGRSGTTFLAALAGLLPEVAAFHEPDPNFADVFRWMLAEGDDDLARRWLVEVKLPRLARVQKRVYLESSHVFCKGFLEPLLDLGFSPALILLRRPNREIARSMYELAAIPGRSLRGDRWYYRPDDPGILPLPGWESLHDYQLCYWYTLEISRRQKVYEELITARGGETLSVDLAELNRPEGFARLARFVTGAAPSWWSRVRFRRLAARPRNVRRRAKELRAMPPIGDLDALERAVHDATGFPVGG